MANSKKDQQLFISTDKSLLDIDYIHSFLESSYWAKGIPKEVVSSSIDHSLCFGLYLTSRQIGFARVISDYTTFAYLADVFVDEKERGKGFGKKLICAVTEHTSLRGIRRWHLVTEDAQGLYKPFGFLNPEKPEKHMEIRRTPDYAMG